MNTEALVYLSKADPALGRVIARIGPIAWKPPRQSLFCSLVESVTSQQLSGKAAATIFARVKALYPGSAFPSPDQLLKTDDDDLRRAGLSRAKVAFVKDIAAKMISGHVPQPRKLAKMSDAEIVAVLTQIHGVGRWTAEMLLMFKLGRPDVLPVHDLAIRKAFMNIYGLAEMPAPAEVEEHGERWRPHRTTASRYLWRSLAT